MTVKTIRYLCSDSQLGKVNTRAHRVNKEDDSARYVTVYAAEMHRTSPYRYPSGAKFAIDKVNACAPMADWTASYL